MLSKAFVDKSTPEEVADYLTASINYDPMLGDKETLKGILTAPTFAGMKVGDYININRFGETRTASFMHRIGMRPEASALTRDMIENNEAFKKRQEFVESHGGTLSVYHVRPYGSFTKDAEDYNVNPTLGEFITHESLSEAFQKHNKGALTSAATLTLAPVVGGATYVMTGDGGTSLVIAAMVPAAGVMLTSAYSATSAFTVDQGQASFAAVIETSKQQRRSKVELEKQPISWNWGFGGGMPQPV